MDTANTSESDKAVQHHFDEMSVQYYNVVDSTPFLYGYYHAKELLWIRTRLRSFLSKADASPSHIRVLDIGCATGRIIGCLDQDAPDSLFVGMDLSSRMIGIARKNRGPHTELIVGDIRSLPFRKSAFDFVYSLEVLEHLDRKPEAIPRAVDEAMRVTRQGGMTTLESTSLWHFRLQEAVQRGLPGIHVSLLQQKSFERYSKVYRNAPLKVAEPSRFNFVSNLILTRGGRIESVSWVRVIPEQTFIVMNNNIIKRLLSKVDELLSKLPGVKRFGREFIISSVKLSD